MNKAYLIVFGIVAVVIFIAAASTLFFSQAPQQQNVSLANLPDYGPAPQLQGIAGWINSNAISISQLKGKVVLIDFWTYSCINCIREEPHVEAWYDAYGNNGLVVIGVSTPEFQFEHNYTNVLNAVRMLGITYPVALDNNYATWDAYDNHDWPAEYVIDANGNVRYVVLGEGGYNQTETVIRELLVASGHTIQSNYTDVPLGVNFSGIGTPEMYLGWQFAEEHGEDYIGNSPSFVPNATVNYTLPSKMYNNTIYLSGTWYNAPDGMVAVNNSKILLTYDAKVVNLVAQGNSTLIVKLDGANLPRDYFGSDDVSMNGTATVNVGPSRLYQVVDGPAYGWHTIEIAASPGFKIYTFTFG